MSSETNSGEFIARTKMRKLVNLLRLWDYHYHMLDDPIVDDSQYDASRKWLVELETAYPHLIVPDSPTQVVGYHHSATFKPWKHNRPMLSLANAFDFADVANFCKRVESTLADMDQDIAGSQKVTYSIDCKMDGLAVSLIYIDGTLAVASTRGDGHVGEDVTDNVRTIRNLPRFIHDAPPEVEIRGEVVVPRKAFDRLNAELATKGEKLYANPRNLAAGSLRQQDVNITASRPLAFYAYDIVEPINAYPNDDTHRGTMFNLGSTKMGFSTAAIPGVRYTAADIQELYLLYCDIRDNPDKVPFDIDGLVIKVSDRNQQRLLGMGSREPNWAIAYKFPSQTAVSTLHAVDWQVGRTGVLTPVARIEPVQVCGVTVSNVTLHNFAEIQRLKLIIGFPVIVSRRGDVIPKIEGIFDDGAAYIGKMIEKPITCPSCNGSVIVINGDHDLRCVNTLECGAQLVNSIAHFSSRNALDIDGLGDAMAQLIADNNLINNLADIFDLWKHADHLCSLEGYGERSVANLMDAINTAKTTELHRLIYGLGIPEVGITTARTLAKHYPSLDALSGITTEELLKLADVGPVTAESINRYMGLNSTKMLFKKLISVGVNWPEQKVESNYQPLRGQSWALTGTLPTLSRGDASDHLRDLGATVTSSVSSKTDVLLAGENAGGKLAKAEELGIRIMSEADFLSEYPMS